MRGLQQYCVFEPTDLDCSINRYENISLDILFREFPSINLQVSSLPP